MIDYATLPTRDIERLSRNIRPGEWAVEAERPISTLLGSCVAVCLFDLALGLAGMNHFMLPQMKQGTHADEDVLLAGDACMEALLNAMLQRGAAKHRMRAKAFGGGAVIDTAVPGSLNVGKRNADFAHQWLEREEAELRASIAHLDRLDQEAGRPRGPRVCLFHYPPIPPGRTRSRFSAVIAEAGASHCIYGHLHGKDLGPARIDGELDGVTYRCTSCDQVGFAPVEILRW